jgi:HSP90 family molecular chaperone
MESIKASSKSVENEFIKFYPEYVLSEYIWNSFDANATEVRIQYSTDHLGTLQSLTILDNGDGIDPTTHELTFGSFKDSQKRLKAQPTTKGKKGIGRFSFFKLSKKIIFDSATEHNSCSIVIDSDSLNNYEVDHRRPDFSYLTKGTRVDFVGPYDKTMNTQFISQKVIPVIIQEFSWLLASSDVKKIFINDENIKLLSHEKKSSSLVISKKNI